MNTGNVAILASAGAGKTYRLANRIVRLLADGAAPQSVVALTFTRKAAAEFVSRVLTNLAKAADSDAEARRLGEAAGRPDLTREDFRALLGKTVAAAHRLRFGTLDSFFQSLVRTHPLELGLNGGFALLDERRAARERRRILRELLRSPAENDDARAFLEAFRLASFGRDARGAATLIGEFAGEARRLYLETGGAESWGDADAVWPEGCAWLPPPDADEFRRAVEKLAAVEAKFGHGTFDNAFAQFREKIADWEPGTPVGTLGAFFEKRLLEPANLVAALRGEPWSFAYSRKDIAVPGDVTAALGVVARFVVGGELRSRLKRAEGAGRLTARYDAAYRRAIVDAGLLSFDDIRATLADPAHSDALAHAAYRLDGVVKHWLFDEFQDTDREAWRIMSANAEEALDDDSGERSVFFVGDVKQALYGWNGGDHRLLPELVAAHDIPVESLVETQRCGPSVLALVNAVFDTVHGAPGLPPVAAEDWRGAWRTHECAPRALANTGYAAWRVVEKPEKGADADEAKLAVVLERLNAGDFLARGLSCGVLTRTNDETLRAAEYLRRHGVPAVSEADIAPAEDNPVTLALLALVRHAAHPGDTLAGETVAMSPLAGTVAASPAGRERLLARFASDGAEASLREVMEESPSIFPDDAFSRRRVADLLDFAREYDATGERDADAFREFAAASKRRDTAAAGRVQVMTVHKSKGLEFDVVFLPFLDGDPVDRARTESFLSLRDDPSSPPRAVIAPPPEAVCEVDAVLRGALHARRAEVAYENLCLLYVALTRAKRETFAVTLPPAEARDEGRASAYPGLLAFCLGEAPWETGDPHWGDAIVAGAPTSETTPPEPATPFAPVVAMQGVTPSGSKGDDVSFEPGEAFESKGKAFGTEVHRLFEKLDRIGRGETAEKLRVRLRAATEAGAPDPGTFREALDHVLVALESPEIRAAFELPAEAVVRTELPFAMTLADGRLLTGTFDRAVIRGDSATLYDFKTDAVAPGALAARYAGAMRLYREAAAALFGITGTRIRLVLLHTPSGRAVELA